MTTQHALLVGVSYSPWIWENRKPDSKYQRLLSVSDDIKLMRSVLESLGFDPVDGIHVLEDDKATQKAILDALDDLADRAGDGDGVLFYFAGHGSTMKDPRDPSRKLETIATFDTGRAPAPNLDIPNLVFDHWVRRLNKKTPNVTLIFDCCFSAGLGRDPFGQPSRGIEADPRTLAEIFDDAPVPDFFREAMHEAMSQPPAPMLRSGWIAAGRRAVVVAACQADEWTWEIGRFEDGGISIYGPLTYYLARALRELGRGATWLDVFEWAAPRVIAAHTGDKRQHPQFEGDLDRVVFGRERIRATPYLPVITADADGIELHGGAAHGVEPGSVWTVRDHGARSRHDGKEIARVRLTEVRPATARGSLETAPATAPEAGQRAFLLERNLPRPELRVAIAGDPKRRNVADAVRASELLELVEERPSGDTGAEPYLLIRYLEPRENAGPRDPCPFLGAIEEPTWVAVGPCGHLQARQRPDGPKAVPGLVSDLEKLARCRGLRRLDNPDPESCLAGKLELRVLDRQGHPLTLDQELCVPRVEAGDAIDFEIVNRHDKEVWVSLVKLAGDHSISVMLPHRGHPGWSPGGHRLAPGETLRVARDYDRNDDGIAQELPEGFPWAAARPAKAAIAEYKLLVTKVPASFDFLEQEPARLTVRHPLRQLALLFHSNFGSPPTILPPDHLSKDQDWTVVTRQIGVVPAEAG